MGQYTERARATMARYRQTAETATDEAALISPELFPFWSADGVTYQTGNRVRYADLLYKCLQEHTSQPSWTPDVVPALWAVIDENHAGTVNDPIPAARGMIYYKDKYYLDPNGKTYLCIRDREDAPGSGLQLQYLPSELVGQYFEEVDS